MSGSQPSKRRRIAGEAKPDLTPIDEADTEKVVLEKAPRLPKLRRPSVSEPTSEDDVLETPETVGTPAPSVPPVAAAPKAKVANSSWILIGVAVVSVLFGAVGAIWGVNQWRGHDIAESRKEAADAAASAAETIFSYQYNKLPQHLAESEATMTPKFAKKFKSIAPALNALAPQRRIQVKGVVRDAATIECGDTCSADKATVLIFIDQARVADGSNKPTVFGNRIQVLMVKQGDRWLVDEIKAM